MKTEKTSHTFEFTVEKSETFVIRRHRESFAHWCDLCMREVESLAPESAAIIAGVNTREVYKRIETGEVHFSEPASGSLIVCLDSLRRCLS